MSTKEPGFYFVIGFAAYVLLSILHAAGLMPPETVVNFTHLPVLLMAGSFSALWYMTRRK